MGSILLGLLAGALTTLSPCVLPILPIVLLGAVGQHRHGPLMLAAGLVSSFTAVGLLLSGATWAFDIPPDAIRAGSAALLLLFGLTLLSASLKERFALLSAPLSNALDGFARGIAGSGLRGQFLMGSLLGAAWTPCSGPTLGAAITLAASGETALEAGAIMLTFSLGAAIPLLALAYGSRETLKTRRNLLSTIGRTANPVLGVALGLIGAAMLLDLDRRVEAVLVNAIPDWLLRFTTQL